MLLPGSQNIDYTRFIYQNIVAKRDRPGLCSRPSSFISIVFSLAEEGKLIGNLRMSDMSFEMRWLHRVLSLQGLTRIFPAILRRIWRGRAQAANPSPSC